MRTITITNGLGCSATHPLRTSLTAGDLPDHQRPTRVPAFAPTPQTVTYTGKDYSIQRAQIHVSPDQRVAKGDILFSDKKNPYARVLSSVAGTIAKVELGHRRSLQKLVIDVGNRGHEPSTVQDAPPADNYPLPESVATLLNSNNSTDIRDGLIQTGLFHGFRTRPFNKLPAPESLPQHIFVTAIDTNPHAPDVRAVLSTKTDNFRSGLSVIEKLTQGSVFVCQPPGKPLIASDTAKIINVGFKGPHPAGNAGTHVQKLSPVGRRSVVWTIDYQEVVAIGEAASDGRLSNARTISVFDTATRQQFLVQAIPGSDIGTLVTNPVGPDIADQTSTRGSAQGGTAYWSGNLFTGGFTSHLGCFDRQVFVFGHDRQAQRPTAGILKKAIQRTKQQVGKTPSALIAEPWLDQVTPLTDTTVSMLRALICGDIETAEACGCLRFADEDIQPFSLLCGERYDFKRLLRTCHQSIEDELLTHSN